MVRAASNYTLIGALLTLVVWSTDQDNHCQDVDVLQEFEEARAWRVRAASLSPHSKRVTNVCDSDIGDDMVSIEVGEGSKVASLPLVTFASNLLTDAETNLLHPQEDPPEVHQVFRQTTVG